MTAALERVGLWVLIAFVFAVLLFGWACEQITGQQFFPEEFEE